MSSTREAVRAFRESMRQSFGPDWWKVIVEQLRDGREVWGSLTFHIYGPNDELIEAFVIASQGGYLGESLPDDEYWATFPFG